MGRNIKYKTLSIKEKLKAIYEVEEGSLVKDVAAKYGVPANNLSTILKNKDKLKKNVQKNPILLTRKRLRLGKFENVDKAVENFVAEARINHLPVNGKMIQDKARQYGMALECNTFNASNGWFNRLKTRTGLKWRCLTGDAAEANKTVAAEWIETILKPILRVHEEKDIFNGDETGLFLNVSQENLSLLKGTRVKRVNLVRRGSP